jgi:hypothetical protein
MDQTVEAMIKAENLVFSDYLYRPYQCSQIDYDSMITLSDQSQKIPLLNNITVKEFDGEWHNKPFMINLDKPIANWTIQSLVDRFKENEFQQEYMNWKLEVYDQYMNHNQDESPLYLFDCGSVVMNQLKNEYKIPLPEIFGPTQDYFELFGSDRPDHRWIIMGPKRSGSTFHKDPNGTSAWNSIITGRKYWIMFPPTVSPPGVYTLNGGEEVMSPFSVAEWFLSGYYQQAKETPGFNHAICSPGQTMYVPSGWWHLVVNLDQGIAMTGNFVPRPKLGVVLDFFKNRPNQISGFKNLSDNMYELFIEKLRQHDHQAFNLALDQLSGIERHNQGKWQQTLQTGFAFNFELEE